MRVLIYLVGLVAFPTGAARAQPKNLYEWLGVAPVIATAENLGTYGKFAEFRVGEFHRGAGEAGSRIRVNVRRANRDRNRYVDKEPLRFEEGHEYVLLLVPVSAAKPDAPPTFEFVRGARGAREVPLEGRDAFVEALTRFVAIQDRNDDVHTWREFTAMIEETNPVVLETALDQFLKFRRGDERLLGSLRPLLDHPSQRTRESVALLIGQILARGGTEPIPDASVLQSELVAKARRDSAVPVRVAATEALGGLEGKAVEMILEEIAREDPDQSVRYAAERLIHDRRGAESDGGSARGPDDDQPPRDRGGLH